jgi:hypothetical protein
MGVVRSGATAFGTGVGFWLAGATSGGGVPQFRVGDPSGNQMSWNGTTLAVTGTVTAAAGAIGGWTIQSNRIEATNIVLWSGAANFASVILGSGSVGGTTAGINAPSISTDIAFWAGATHTNRATAPFRVTVAGALTASDVNITAGNAVIDGDGITLPTGTSFTDDRAYKFENVGTDSGNFGMAGIRDVGGGASSKEVHILADNDDSANDQIGIINALASGDGTFAQVKAEALAGNPTTRLVANDGSNSNTFLVSATETSSEEVLTASAGTRTLFGTVSANHATATTILTVPAAAGLHIVFATVAGSGSAANYTAFATVLVEGATARIATNDGALLTLTLSGLNVQATQSSGVSQTVTYRSLRIS